MLYFFDPAFTILGLTVVVEMLLWEHTYEKNVFVLSGIVFQILSVFKLYNKKVHINNAFGFFLLIAESYEIL